MLKQFYCFFVAWTGSMPTYICSILRRYQHSSALGPPFPAGFVSHMSIREAALNF
uniref:Uncharacterized protein n=1 Tax=Anguilla anguilla TaxID=7936 RepID=A0A0E9U0P8_ANGAN